MPELFDVARNNVTWVTRSLIANGFSRKAWRSGDVPEELEAASDAVMRMAGGALQHGPRQFVVHPYMIQWTAKLHPAAWPKERDVLAMGVWVPVGDVLLGGVNVVEVLEAIPREEVQRRRAYIGSIQPLLRSAVAGQGCAPRAEPPAGVEATSAGMAVYREARDRRGRRIADVVGKGLWDEGGCLLEAATWGLVRQGAEKHGWTV